MIATPIFLCRRPPVNYIPVVNIRGGESVIAWRIILLAASRLMPQTSFRRVRPALLLRKLGNFFGHAALLPQILTFNKRFNFDYVPTFWEPKIKIFKWEYQYAANHAFSRRFFEKHQRMNLLTNYSWGWEKILEFREEISDLFDSWPLVCILVWNKSLTVWTLNNQLCWKESILRPYRK